MRIEAQWLPYWKLGGWKVGLLVDFDVAVLKDGIRRRVLGFPEPVNVLCVFFAFSAPLR